MMFLDKPHPQMLHMVYAMCMHAHGLSGPQSAAIHREAQPKIYDVHGAELQGLHMKVFQADQWASAGSAACCTSDILQIEALVLSALSKPETLQKRKFKKDKNRLMEPGHLDLFLAFASPETRPM